MCGATGTSSQEAEFKAIMESYERSISSHKFYKFEGSAHELARLEMDWINPMYYVPLTEKQITENGFDKFDEDLELQWINGYYYENHIKNEVYVPTDLVFYGFKHNSMINVFIMQILLEWRHIMMFVGQKRERLWNYVNEMQL